MHLILFSLSLALYLHLPSKACQGRSGCPIKLCRSLILDVSCLGVKDFLRIPPPLFPNLFTDPYLFSPPPPSLSFIVPRLNFLPLNSFVLTGVGLFLLHVFRLPSSFCRGAQTCLFCRQFFHFQLVVEGALSLLLMFRFQRSPNRPDVRLLPQGIIVLASQPMILRTAWDSLFPICPLFLTCSVSLHSPI